MNELSQGSRHGRTLLSTPVRYAIRALVTLGDHGVYRLAKDIAKELNLPLPYLAKILQSLTLGGVLESMRGPTGGFRLHRPAHRISLQEVIAALEGSEPREECLLGSGACGQGRQCPLHPVWDQIQGLLQDLLRETTIRDLQLACDGGPSEDGMLRGLRKNKETE